VQFWFWPDAATILKVTSAARRRSAASVRLDAKTSAVTAIWADAAMLLRHARVSVQIARARAEDARSRALVSAKTVVKNSARVSVLENAKMLAKVSVRASAKKVAKASALDSATKSATKNVTRNAKK